SFNPDWTYRIVASLSCQNREERILTWKLLQFTYELTLIRSWNIKTGLFVWMGETFGLHMLGLKQDDQETLKSGRQWARSCLHTGTTSLLSQSYSMQTNYCPSYTGSRSRNHSDSVSTSDNIMNL
ncbi:hypothetical protein MAR_012092, partial [Mya arenaria]